MTIAQATDYGTDEIMNSPKKTTQVPIAPNERFVDRHVGLDAAEIKAMLDTLGCPEMSTLLSEVIPEAIRTSRPLDLAEPAGPEGLGEHDAIETLRAIAAGNLLFRNHIGMGYHGTVTPPVIRRAILENPGWYTQYTPYQAEISQGRLEALLNFQTMISDLTGLPIAGASLLDEATAAAEAMVMCVAHTRSKKKTFFVSCHCHPQTIAVIRTRADGLGITVVVGDPETFDPSDSDLAGLLVQYPRTDGVVDDYRALVARATEHGVLVVAAADPMSLCLLTPPGEWGAAIAVGSTQRFGVPMGFGGPHAAYLACREDLMRKMPGRLIGVSKDTNGKTALRMALQTREQHIRRDKATSNICTAQVLLAIIASMYGVYHGPAGLRAIASRINRLTNTLAEGLRRIGHNPTPEGRPFFDTLFVRLSDATDAPTIHDAANACNVNLRHCEDPAVVGVTLDETTRPSDVAQLLAIFSAGTSTEAPALTILPRVTTDFGTCTRTSDYMTHAVFNQHHSETELMRYAATLQGRDLSLTHSMIPLGSCTMKLNAAAEMLPITWPTISNLHPFAPPSQTVGMIEMIQQLESWLAEITGFCAVSMQPNAGSQGEYAGLMVIRAFHRDNNQSQRTKCIIPLSAHGTNPASAVVAGMDVVPVKCTDDGDIDLNDLRARIETCGDELAAVMITYPSTHGVFEAGVIEACKLIHDAGGMVYLDGANMNAQVGLARPAELGADVCHLNLHKTFAIPHGGGGPGMGPIGVVEKLRPFLPTHPVLAPKSAGEKAIGPVSAAPYGSGMVLPISWMYIAMMGADGLRHASELAILSANYMAKRLAEHFDVLFVNEHGRCAHEFILDCRAFDKSVGIKIDDIAKRLMDYGFHAPTMSWPVPGTLMVEPTESESLAELDRYCDALIFIRQEIAAIENGESDASDNPLKNAPHTMAVVAADEWTHPYTRTQAAFPAPWLRERKFWTHVGRVDNPYGDRNLACSCEGMDAY